MRRDPFCLLPICLLACSESRPVFKDQVPPVTGHDAIEAWLVERYYDRWRCEDVPREPRFPSDHGKSRICSNDLASAAGPGEFPVDATSVKEFYDRAGQVVGYSVERHTRPGKGGDSWYWYERVAMDSPVPHDARGVVADGWGGSGPAKELCAGCHGGAGIDEHHSGHDFVYTQVR